MAVATAGLLVRRALIPALCLLVGGYFLLHALAGPTSLPALEGIRSERAKLLEKRAQLEAERAELERHIALLDPRGADPDLADELVRRYLGVIRPDEIMVPLPKTDGSDG
ncbi:MAG: septum formation initiator family protein [Sphingomonadaceae bacterium]